jgi:hypothetical protein
MATLNTVLKLKRSKIPGNVPDASLLDSGELAINTADGILYYKDASNEVKKLSDSDLIASTYLALSGGTMSGTINMGNNDIINVVDPVNEQDAATKNYVDLSLLEVGVQFFPTGNYGKVDSDLITDAFGISLFSTFDCLTTPTAILQTQDLGVLT